MSVPQDVVLVVEDHPLNLELMSLLLEAEALDVGIARDAHEALRILPELRPAILVTDVQLPGMSGLELVTRVRSDPQYDAMSIVVVTSYAMDSDREAAFLAGCDEYLSKPIDTRTFGARVRASGGRGVKSRPAFRTSAGS